jgi:hypothetical protein
MRPSLEGTQARREGESHPQEAHGADGSYGEAGYGQTGVPMSQCGDHPAASDAGERPSTAPDTQGTHGVVEAHREGGLAPSRPRTRTRLCGAQGPSQTIPLRGHASRPGSPGVRGTAGHLRLTEPWLCEQRRNLLGLPQGEADRSPRSQQGQRVRSRRWRHDPPGRWRKASTGRRDLETRSFKVLWTGESEAIITAQRRRSPLVGTPDALKGACPVWGGLGGNRPQGTAPSFYSIAVRHEARFWNG